MGLREATAELHSKAEKMEFNQRMFRGELTEFQYLNYLHTQSIIFQCIEEHGLSKLNPNIKRLKNIFEDIQEIEKRNSKKVFDNINAKEYGKYLEGLKGDNLYPHIYLNYLALMFGGQMMKSKVPGSGKMYEFENVQDCIGSIRAIQKDEWADEVNKGFSYIINIFDELQRKTF
jgi:heme oxygenase